MKSALFFPLDAILANNDQELGYYPLLSAALMQYLAGAGCNLKRVSLHGLFGGSTLDIRTHHVLWQSGVRWLADLVAMTPNALFSLRNFGLLSYQNLVEHLRAYLAPWWDDLVAIDAEESDHPLPHTRLSDSDLVALLDLWEIEWQHVPASQALREAGECAGVTIYHLSDVARALESAPAGLSALLPKYKMRGVMRDLTHAVAEDLAGLLVSTVADLPDVTANVSPGAEEPISVAALLEILAARARGGMAANANTRALDLLFARWGIEDGQPKTLNELGVALGLTRERVRQLIARAEERLGQPELLPLVRGLGLPVARALAALGGVARVSDVAASVARLLQFGAVDPVRATHLLASWSDQLRLIADDRLALNHYPDMLIAAAEAAIAATLEAYPDGLAFDTFVEQVQFAGGDDLRDVERAFVAAVVRCADRMVIADGECRPAGRGSLRARLMAALRAVGHPAHFTELAAAYRDLFPDEAARTDNAIHASMDRFRDDFVLVGSGIFVLAEWGYDPAIRDVASVVKDVLRQAEQPLHRDEVVRRVAERYRWKPNSVAAALAADEHIRAFGNAFFGLAEREYAPFDPEMAYAHLFGIPKVVRKAIVADAQTNERGNSVLRLHLTASVLQGYLPLSNRQTRACFPDMGGVSALCCGPSGELSEIMLHRGNTSVSGLSVWFAAIGARAGDELLVERLDDALPGEPRYLLVYVPTGHTAEALRLVGLRPDTPSAGSTAATEQRLRRSNLDAVRQLVWHALAHPWAEISDTQTALAIDHAGTQGSAYQRLGVRLGMMTDGQMASHGAGLIFRPTRAGRGWVSGSSESDAVAQQCALALRLPAYRQHLCGCASANLSPLVATRWDHRFDLAPRSTPAQTVLNASSAFVLARDLRRSGLALLFLLLAAQSHGLGITLAAPSLGAAGAGVEAAAYLRAQGLALVFDATGRAALDERVTLGIDDTHALEARLRDFAAPVGTALADAWCAIQPVCAAAGTVNASELFDALRAGAPKLLSDVLTGAPATLSDTARAVDGDLADCAFPGLVADGGWMHDQPGAPFAFWRNAVARLGIRGSSAHALTGVCLCDDLMRRPWDAPHNLGANAHLALLVALAGDIGGIAERIHHGEDGWELGGLPLVVGLDRALGALGYDVWDERYRDDPVVRAALAEAVVALGERLGLLRAEGLALEAVGPLASDVYYGVYYADHDPLARVRDALSLAAVL